MDWISVDDRLPENDALVFFSHFTGTQVGLDIAFYDDGQWWNNSDRLVLGVTHWMPLPKPPVAAPDR